jgi:enterochelin esterase-like enzyme
VRGRAGLCGAIALVVACASSPSPAPLPTATAAASPALSPTPASLGKGRLEKGTFRSVALGRTMSYVVYLPPGYDANPAARYPVAFALHGGGGDIMEWPSYGLFDAADRLMGDRSIPPFVIVLPEGDQEYWVDHVVDRTTGANGEKWGTYTAREVVPTIDARYRTIATPAERAIGGLSMGGHGAMQLALNFPGIWSAIAATSPSIRPLGEAPTYLGTGQAEFAARDPLSLIAAKPDVARAYAWWIDTGDTDPWLAQAAAIHAQLTALLISHEWHVWPGDHSAQYWSKHVDDYLRYYASVLCRDPARCPAAR